MCVASLTTYLLCHYFTTLNTSPSSTSTAHLLTHIKVSSSSHSRLFTLHSSLLTLLSSRRGASTTAASLRLITSPLFTPLTPAVLADAAPAALLSWTLTLMAAFTPGDDDRLAAAAAAACRPATNTAAGDMPRHGLGVGSVGGWVAGWQSAGWG